MTIKTRVYDSEGNPYKKGLEPGLVWEEISSGHIGDTLNTYKIYQTLISGQYVLKVMENIINDKNSTKL